MGERRIIQTGGFIFLIIFFIACNIIILMAIPAPWNIILFILSVPMDIFTLWHIRKRL